MPPAQQREWQLLWRGSIVFAATGMPLDELNLCQTQVTDISPLHGLTIKSLWLRENRNLYFGTNNTAASSGPEIAEGIGAVVQEMRKTEQTSQYLDGLGPFFIGKAVWQAPQ